MKSVFIYGLKDPLTEEIRYVGKSTDPSRRYCEHVYESKVRRIENKHKHRWIQKLLNAGNKPELVILEECDHENWKEKEIYWLSIFPRLTNKAPGGIQPPNSKGRKHSQQTKDLLSRQRKGKNIWEGKNHPCKGKPNPRKGMPQSLTAEERKRRSECMKNNTRWQKRSEEGLARMAKQNQVSIDLIDRNGVVLETFPSVSFAEKRFNLTKGSVSRVCKGEYSHTKGLKFCYSQSSRMCSDCGHKQDMPLKERIYQCGGCGAVKDRDLNASINIKNWPTLPMAIGIRTLVESVGPPPDVEAGIKQLSLFV